jgi:hypothetical protein
LSAAILHSDFIGGNFSCPLLSKSPTTSFLQISGSRSGLTKRSLRAPSQGNLTGR